MQLTAAFQRVPEGFIGFVREIPGVNTQAATLEEARESLSEALELVLDVNRELFEETIVGQEVIREDLNLDHLIGGARIAGPSTPRNR